MNTVDYPNSISQKPLHRNLQSRIVTLYGGDTWKEIRNLKKTRVKRQRKESDLYFPPNCHPSPYLSQTFFSLLCISSPDDESCSRLETSIKRKKMNTVDYLNSISQKPLHRNLQSRIVTLYGGDTWKEIGNLEKTRVKIQGKESDLYFPPNYLPSPYLSQTFFSLLCLSSPNDESCSKLEMSTKRKKMNTVDYLNSIYQKPLHRNLQSRIVTLYRGDTWKEIRNLEKTRVKIQRKESDLYFPPNCHPSPYLSQTFFSLLCISSPDDESCSRLETSTKRKRMNSLGIVLLYML